MEQKKETIERVNRLPSWMKVPLPKGQNYSRVKNLVTNQKLNTICVSGNCPNKGECWNAGTATFMILGEKCTRNCRFCQVTSLKPDPIDYEEPQRLANTIKSLSLKHAVITSVSRDDLEDGGAQFWAECIKKVKEQNPELTMEVLIPDFRRSNSVLDIIIKEKPEVISHNLETVKRLSLKIRSMATYDDSLALLNYVAKSGTITKTGIMLGMGETEEEILQTMKDAFNAGVKVFTVGQYLRPSLRHYPVKEYIHPDTFAHIKKEGLKIGFRHVESGPQVRSSYHAEKHVY